MPQLGVLLYPAIPPTARTAVDVGLKPKPLRCHTIQSQSSTEHLRFIIFHPGVSHPAPRIPSPHVTVDHCLVSAISTLIISGSQPLTSDPIGEMIPSIINGFSFGGSGLEVTSAT